MRLTGSCIAARAEGMVAAMKPQSPTCARRRKITPGAFARDT